MGPAFSKLSELNHKFILETMSGPSPAETVTIRGDVAFEGVARKVVSMEDLALVPMTLRSPRPKPKPIRET